MAVCFTVWGKVQ